MTEGMTHARLLLMEEERNIAHSYELRGGLNAGHSETFRDLIRVQHAIEALNSDPYPFPVRHDFRNDAALMA